MHVLTESGTFAGATCSDRARVAVSQDRPLHGGGRQCPLGPSPSSALMCHTVAATEAEPRHARALPWGRGRARVTPPQRPVPLGHSRGTLAFSPSVRSDRSSGRGAGCGRGALRAARTAHAQTRGLPGGARRAAGPPSGSSLCSRPCLP